MSHNKAMSCWHFRRPSAWAPIGFIGLVIVTTLLSSCAGRSPTSSEVALVSSSSSVANLGGGGGPQTPPCGMFEVARTEIVSGQQFLKGQYQINTFGISCDEVMGEEGLFSKFLQLGDNEELPEPWRFLEGAVGAPKFVSGSAPGVGFRVQMISD
jgi:hypothetical protein